MDSQTLCLRDRDQDGYGDSSPSEGINSGTDCNDEMAIMTPVDLDGDGLSGCDGDCDDSDPYAGPDKGELEVINLCYRDFDGDGYGDANPVSQLVDAGSDCVDTETIFYGAQVKNLVFAQKI